MKIIDKIKSCFSHERGTGKYFGVETDKIDGWSFGACMSYDNWLHECYLFVNLFKWNIRIGVMNKKFREDDYED